MIRAFVPTFSQAQSQQKLQKLLAAGKRASATSPIPKAPCAMWWQIMGKRA